MRSPKSPKFLTIFLRSLTLWIYGGLLYNLAEEIYKTATGHPERINFTMMILGTLLSIPLDLCNERMPWKLPLLIQGLLGSLAITVSELIAGLFLNCLLGLGIWDYSALPGNLFGQICPQFTLLWFFVALLGILFFDWFRYLVYDESRPHYKLF